MTEMLSFINFPELSHVPWHAITWPTEGNILYIFFSWENTQYMYQEIYYHIGSQQYYEFRYYSYLMEEAEITMLLETLSIWLQKLQNSNELNLLIPACP